MLEQFATVDRAKKARGRLLAAYIRSRVHEAQLVDWSVVLINNTQAPKPAIPFVGESIGLTMRSYYRAGMADDAPIEGDYTIRRLADPGHESLDLTETEARTAEEMRAAELRRNIALALVGAPMRWQALGIAARRHAASAACLWSHSCAKARLSAR